MKICIISNSHQTNDVRLYHKLGHSLSSISDVYILSVKGPINLENNPRQIIVQATSPVKALPKLYQEARKLKPDIVICIEPLTFLVGILLKKTLKTKLVFDIHEFFAEAHAERYSPYLKPFVKVFYLGGLKYLASFADAKIAVNQDILNQLFGLKAKDEMHIVLPNYPVKGVWEKPKDIPLSLGSLTELSFDLIYIGGISKDRGIFKILHSISILKGKNPHLRILIVGKFADTKTEQEFSRYVNRYNLHATIYMQDWVAPDKIGLLLARSRFGLWIFDPAVRRLKLALPLKVLEYFAAGLPLITIKTPLMKSLVEYPKLGILSSYRSREIARSIQTMLDIPESEYNAMRQRCLEISRTRYVWESLEEKLFALIHKLR